jgi:hypothetical protein
MGGMGGMQGGMGYGNQAMGMQGGGMGYGNQGISGMQGGGMQGGMQGNMQGGGMQGGMQGNMVSVWLECSWDGAGCTHLHTLQMANLACSLQMANLACLQDTGPRQQQLVQTNCLVLLGPSRDIHSSLPCSLADLCTLLTMC